MSGPDGFGAFALRVRQAVEEFLARAFRAWPDTTVRQAAMYAATDGGHRWRAMAAIAAGAIFDRGAFEICLPLACGAELAHTASLVLDDLPSMDNGHLRRGKPCVHLAFPRWAVDMAPVFLVTMAYEISLNNPLAPAERRVVAAVELSRAGLRMTAGQEHDLTQRAAAETEEGLLERHRLKTGEAFAAAAKGGAILCGASAEEVQALCECGMKLGVSYQIADDVADRVAAAEEVAKSVNRDCAKVTFVDLFGVEGARAQAGRYRGESLAALDAFGPQADPLRTLVSRACCLEP